MEICEYDHDEVVYLSRKCPVCEAKEEVARLEKEVGELKDQLESWKQH